METFLNAPLWMVEFLSIGLAVLVGVGLHRLVQRFVPYSRLLKHNDVAGFLIAVIAVVYGVVLGFVVIIVWGKYDDAVRITQRELSSAADLYRLARGLPQKDTIRLQSDLRKYAHLIIEDEWPSMNVHTASMASFVQSERIAQDVVKFKSSNGSEESIHSAALQALSNMLDARRERMRANTGVVQPLMWFTLFLGMASIIGFSYFFGTENQTLQLGMTAIICAVVTSMLVLVAEYNTPFSGQMAVSPDAWAAFLRYSSHLHP